MCQFYYANQIIHLISLRHLYKTLPQIMADISISIAKQKGNLLATEFLAV